MTTEFVEIKSGATVKEALAKIKKVGRDAETIDTTFVIDSSRHLIGTLNLDELIFAEEDTIVDTIMDDDYVSTVTSTDQEEIGELFKNMTCTSCQLSIKIIDLSVLLQSMISWMLWKMKPLRIFKNGWYFPYRYSIFKNISSQNCKVSYRLASSFDDIRHFYKFNYQ